MQCGHCSADYHPQTSKFVIGKDAEWLWQILWERCPRCDKFNIRLVNGEPNPVDNSLMSHNVHGSRVVHPKGGLSRQPAAPEVPKEIAEDYNEACLVLADSAKASAALSRRCLQTLLREHAKVKPQNLNKEIDEVLASKTLPPHLASDIHAIRAVGNFAAHPTKDTSTGEIVDVEPGEAEWLLDLLVGLFGFYFVEPAEAKRDGMRSTQSSLLPASLPSDAPAGRAQGGPFRRPFFTTAAVGTEFFASLRRMAPELSKTERGLRGSVRESPFGLLRRRTGQESNSGTAVSGFPSPVSPGYIHTCLVYPGTRISSPTRIERSAVRRAGT